MFLLMVFSVCASAEDTYPYKDNCPTPSGGNKIVDQWKFYQCECTSYVAHKLNENGISFKNDYGGVHWGDASNWKSVAKSIDITTTGTPRVGDVAWFSNHVAYVEEVNGENVVISEYNRTPYKHGIRIVSISDVGTFIRFQTIFRVVGEVGWYPPTKTCINADEWVRIVDGRAIQSFQNNGICWSIDPIAHGVWYDVVFGSDDLPAQCTE